VKHNFKEKKGNNKMEETKEHNRPRKIFSSIGASVESKDERYVDLFTLILSITVGF
jgi:hypothetical protein